MLGLIGDSATQPLIDNLEEVAPGPAREIFTDAIRNLQSSQGSAGLLFVVGLAVALWSASGYVGGLHARLERHLRHRGGAADLEDPPGARRH